MESQVYDATIGGVVYNVTAAVGGALDFSTDKTFGGDVSIGGNLEVDSIVAPVAGITMDCDLVVDGDVQITGDLDVTGLDIEIYGGLALTIGEGTPEGVRTAAPGAMYENRDGGANVALYLKETGSGNTGWKAVGPTAWNGHDELSDVAYDDCIVVAGATRAPAVDPVAQAAWLTSLQLPKFLNAGGKYLDLGFQLPHNYVPGTALAWHVHFTNESQIADTETVIFRLVFTAAPIWGVFPAVATYGNLDATFTNNAATRALLPAGSLSGTNIVANCHLIAGTASISGTGLTLSSIVHGRIERTTDSHSGDVWMLSADAHIQKNRLGSENETTG